MEAIGDEVKDGSGSPDLTCPHCGGANLASARVCQDCGRRLDLRHRSGSAAAAFVAEDDFETIGLSEGEAAPRFRPLDSDDRIVAHEPTDFLDDISESSIGGVQACAQCGAEDFVSARFCRACGARFGAAGSALALGTVPRGRSIGFAPIAVAAVGLAAMIVLAAWAARIWRQPSASSSVVPTSSPAAVAPAPSGAAPADAMIAAAPPIVVAPPSINPLKRMISDPIWIRRPGAADVSALYPKRAQAKGVQGEATIDCLVNAAGRLSVCRVITESPPRLGFGRATIKLAPDFQMKALTRSGQAVADRRVRVPIRWRLTE